MYMYNVCIVYRCIWLLYRCYLLAIFNASQEILAADFIKLWRHCLSWNTRTTSSVWSGSHNLCRSQE